MGRQFYIEEGFTSHPKVVEVGGDAGWLHLCAMDWASQKLTGRIPKRLVPQLSDRRQPMALAARLVQAGLWHDLGDAFEIHDWEQRNQKMLNARRKAKHAAEVRYGKTSCLEHAPSIAPSMPEAELGACPPSRAHARNQRSNEPTNQRTNDPSASSSMASNTTSTSGDPGGDQTTAKLVTYWLTAVIGQDPNGLRLKDQLEVRAAVDFLRRWLDPRAIEERIGAVANGKTRPRSVNYLISACRSWGAEQGIQVPPFTLATRQPPPDLATEKESA